jgi:hypothetical protein
MSSKTHIQQYLQREDKQPVPVMVAGEEEEDDLSFTPCSAELQ